MLEEIVVLLWLEIESNFLQSSEKKFEDGEKGLKSDHSLLNKFNQPDSDSPVLRKKMNKILNIFGQF